MKILITGICGFAGTAIAESLLERREGLTIAGIDNLHRPGSEINRVRLRKRGVKFIQGDIRMASDFQALPAADWVIDAAANPSVLAGLQGTFNSRQLFEHNLASIVNVLEYCKAHRAGLLLLSTSRVYSIPALTSLPLVYGDAAFRLNTRSDLPHGLSTRGIGVDFSTRAPVSLYGATKLACESMALEYGEAFQFPVWIDRCGVLAGSGQFGTPEQGIVAYWINAHLRGRTLRYIGFDGTGRQVRDLLHPRDLAVLLDVQMRQERTGGQRIYTAGGGQANSISLAELAAWCDTRFGPRPVEADLHERPYDIPWVVMDNTDCERHFGWQPDTAMSGLLEEVARHAEANPEWLERSGV
jgi:CDP-paratose 2-epimerase